MPKATAVWLLENTSLTFDQIADFCGLHKMEVQAIADAEVAIGLTPVDPIAAEFLTWDEIERCSKDPATRLEISSPKEVLPAYKRRTRYTPVAKRADKPNAIAWVLKHHPELSDAAICRLLGTTSPTINAIRNRTHWNSENIRSQSPIELGLCTQKELDEAVSLAGIRK